MNTLLDGSAVEPGHEVERGAEVGRTRNVHRSLAAERKRVRSLLRLRELEVANTAGSWSTSDNELVHLVLHGTNPPVRPKPKYITELAGIFGAVHDLARKEPLQSMGGRSFATLVETASPGFIAATPPSVVARMEALLS